MKRTIVLSSSAFVFMCVVSSWAFGTYGAGSLRETGQQLTLILVNMLIGLGASFLVLRIVAKLIGRRMKPFSRKVHRAVVLTTITAGLFAAPMLNFEIGLTLRYLFGDLTASSHLLVNESSVWMLLIASIVGWITVAYVLPLIYEEWIGRRSRMVAPVVSRKERLFLLLKLALGGFVVWLLVLATMSGDWTGILQRGGIMDDLTGSRRVESDSIVVIDLILPAMSHYTYLNGVRRVGMEVDKHGARIKLVILPADLEQSSRIAGVIRDIATQGNVVFAVPPQHRTRNTDIRLAENPIHDAIPIDWGVASTMDLKDRYLWWPPLTFRPVGYIEETTGEVVPEAVLRLVARFVDDADTTHGHVEGSRFTMGSYSTGLFADGEAPIVRRLATWKLPRGAVSWQEDNDTLRYAYNNMQLTTLDSAGVNAFRGKIVILDPGGSAGFPAQGESYGETAAIITHQILRGYSRTPLDTWTDWIVLGTLVACIAMMLYLQPIVAAIVIFMLGYGDLILGMWISNQLEVVAQILPPALTAFWSVPVLLFVRVFHDRRRLESREKKRAEEELKTAREMQMGLMPTVDPTIPGFQISGICRPANEVGGDFFDYVWLDDRKTRLGIVIVDVSGKAMKAAITAVLTSGMLYREMGTKDTPKTILRKINKPMYLKTDRRVFTAMTFAVLDVKKKTLQLSNAGQTFPVLIRGGKSELVRLKGQRLPLGVQEETLYEDRTVRLKKGDTVLFYTDGITEAMNEKGEMYGFERFVEATTALDTDRTARQSVGLLMDSVTGFAGSAAQHDDMTIVSLRVLA